MAHSRPNYLYVCLDSIRRCREVDTWDIWVSFDGGPSASDHRLCHGVLPFYSITHGRNIGNRDHPTEMLRAARYFNYERVVFVEDDMLFRSDLLNWIRSEEPGWSGTISSHHFHDAPREQIAHMSSAPCSLSYNHIQELLRFMDSKAYIGLENICNHQPITPSVTYDVCWYAWCIKSRTVCRFVPVQLSFNFGFNGMHFKNSHFDALAFAGDKSQWIENILRLSQEPEFSAVARTPGFVNIE